LFAERIRQKEKRHLAFEFSKQRIATSACSEFRLFERGTFFCTYLFKRDIKISIRKMVLLMAFNLWKHDYLFLADFLIRLPSCGFSTSLIPTFCKNFN